MKLQYLEDILERRIREIEVKSGDGCTAALNCLSNAIGSLLEVRQALAVENIAESKLEALRAHEDACKQAEEGL